MIRVLIADDHEMFVDGIVSILQDARDIEVTGWCYRGREVLETLMMRPADVLLLDLNLPDCPGLEVARRVLHSLDGVRIIALTMHNEPSYILQALQLGVHSYILKDSGKRELLTAIRTVNEGGQYISPEVSRIIHEHKRDRMRLRRSKDSPWISRRERQVLELIVKEHTTQEIAEKLSITLKTVETHRRNLMTKLNVRNIAGLVRKALEKGLIDIDQ